MVQQLVKGMYGTEFSPKAKLFGLRCGQVRGMDLIHNGGWYDGRGEKLGWGDLCKEDLLRISSELEDGESFIVLRESDSFWPFVSQPGVIGSMSVVDPTEAAPDADYVASRCCYIITNHQLYAVEPPCFPHKDTFHRGGLEFKVLDRKQAKSIILHR